MNETEHVQKIVDFAINKIDNSTIEELRKDMKQLVTTLCEVVGKQQPDLLNPNTPEEKRGKLFFKMIGGIVADAMNPFKKKQMEHDFKKVIELYPLLQKYSAFTE